MSTCRVLAFAGSLRDQSFNRRLIHIAAAGARDAGADVTILDLREHRLPIFDQDLEQTEGIPETAKKLKDIFRDHDALLISSPEYNSSFSAVFKNTIDWVSRPEDDHPPLSCFDGKVAGIMAASPGGLGGLRGLVHVRAMLQNIKVMVVPQQMAISNAADAFDDDDQLKDDSKQEAIHGIARRVVKVATALK